jgi:hypothetical protein
VLGSAAALSRDRADVAATAAAMRPDCWDTKAGYALIWCASCHSAIMCFTWLVIGPTGSIG